jgi:hypothetical protein
LKRSLVLREAPSASFMSLEDHDCGTV